MINTELSNIITSLSKGIDPTTGELFDTKLLADPAVYRAIKRLRRASNEVYEFGDIKKESQNKLGRPANRIFEDLKAWRLEVSQMIGRPAYTIFSNEDLWAIAEGNVVEKEDLLRVRGIGHYSYEEYGEDVYKILEPYIKEK